MEEIFQKIVDDGPELFDLERINNFIDRNFICKHATTDQSIWQLSKIILSTLHLDDQKDQCKANKEVQMYIF
jgi:hypothetical protein